MYRIARKYLLSDFPLDFSDKLLEWASNHDLFAWLDSNDYPQKYSEFDKALAIGSITQLQSDYLGAFDKLKSLLDKQKDYYFGYLAYDLKNDLEKLTSANEDFLHFPDLFFFQPAKLIVFKDKYVQFLYHKSVFPALEKDIRDIISKESTKQKTHPPFELNPKISQSEYLKKAEKIQQHIRRGDTYETNFCMEFFAKNVHIDPLSLYREVNQQTKAPFSVFFRNNEHYLISASPERFVKKEAQKIITQPIKGTAPRNADPEIDNLLKENLKLNPKERSENIMIVDLVRNDLSKEAMKGSVIVEELCEIYTFPNIHQLISTVSCEVNKETHRVDILKNLFPMGSMTGAPKISTMKIIEKQENTKRSLYSGAFGYFDPIGNFDFNVVIRSFLYNSQNQYLSLSVGSAITDLSVPEKEHEECLVKAESLLNAIKKIT